MTVISALLVTVHASYLEPVDFFSSMQSVSYFAPSHSEDATYENVLG